MSEAIRADFTSDEMANGVKCKDEMVGPLFSFHVIFSDRAVIE